MRKRRFTAGETVAMSTLLLSIVVALLCIRSCNGSSGADILRADSIYKAKADSVDRVISKLPEAGSAGHDSIGSRKKRKKAKPRKSEYVQRQRSYLDEELSRDNAR